MRILIAEDETAMRRILRLYLEKEGYEVLTAADGQEAFDLLCQTSCDLLIADWMMPRMDGIKLCREVRSYSLPTKIIMLTAKDSPEHEFTGLSCGADDYIRKPFEPKVLLLRIRKLLGLGQPLRCGDLTLNPDTGAAYRGGEELKLTQKEYLLLQLFMQNKGTTLPRELLLTRIWGSDYDGDERTLDTHIRRLRTKIGKERITTKVGMGYRLEEISGGGHPDNGHPEPGYPGGAR